MLNRPGLFVLGVGALLYGLVPRLAVPILYSLVLWSFVIEIIGSSITDDGQVGGFAGPQEIFLELGGTFVAGFDGEIAAGDHHAEPGRGQWRPRAARGGS